MNFTVSSFLYFEGQNFLRQIFLFMFWRILLELVFLMKCNFHQSIQIFFKSLFPYAEQNYLHDLIYYSIGFGFAMTQILICILQFFLFYLAWVLSNVPVWMKAILGYSIMAIIHKQNRDFKNDPLLTFFLALLSISSEFYSYFVFIWNLNCFFFLFYVAQKNCSLDDDRT